jgi:hypothetical protein
VHGIETLRIEEIIFFAIVWFVSFAAAFSRTVRDGEFRNVGNACAVGFTAGLFSFGVVAFLIDRDPSNTNRAWYYIGLSALIGLMAKEQDKWARAILSNAFTILRVLTQKGKSYEEESQSESDRDNPKPEA